MMTKNNDNDDDDIIRVILVSCLIYRITIQSPTKITIVVNLHTPNTHGKSLIITYCKITRLIPGASGTPSPLEFGVQGTLVPSNLGQGEDFVSLSS